jgi:hypothetical protein
MADPNNRFDALLEAMLTKPDPSAEPAPDVDGDAGEDHGDPEDC